MYKRSVCCAPVTRKQGRFLEEAYNFPVSHRHPSWQNIFNSLFCIQYICVGQGFSGQVSLFDMFMRNIIFMLWWTGSDWNVDTTCCSIVFSWSALFDTTPVSITVVTGKTFRQWVRGSQLPHRNPLSRPLCDSTSYKK